MLNRVGLLPVLLSFFIIGIAVSGADAAVKTYDEQVAEARNYYASQRSNLGLSNAPGEGSTPESNMGCNKEPGFFAPNGGMMKMMDKAWKWLRDVTGAEASEQAFAAKCQSEWDQWSECRQTMNEGSCEDGWRFEKSVEYCDSYVSQECQDEADRHQRAVAGVRGAPKWNVNKLNLNLHMADIPLWYSPPIGPAMELKLSYNSLTSTIGALGNKWLLNFGSYLYTMSDNYGQPAATAVIMPDGKWDLYGLPDGNGLCSPPYQVFNTLTRLSGTRYELKSRSGTTFVYDIPSGTTSSVSLLVEVNDAYGQKLTMHYDAAGKLTSVTDATGKSTTFTYDASGYLSQVTDPFGRFASFEHDANGNLTKITDMGGYWSSFTYDSNSYLSSLTNASGTWTFYFEPADGLDNGSDPYPAPGTAMGSNWRLTITDPSQGKAEYYKHPGGSWYISPKNYIPYTDATHNNYAGNAPKTLYGFFMTTNRRGEIGSITTPEGYSRDFSYEYSTDPAYHDSGNLLGMSVPGGGFGFTYNTNGKITSSTEIWGMYQPVTNMTYAANGVDATNIADGLGTITFGYNGFHDITSVTDRLGHTRSQTFNQYGQRTSATDELGTVTNYVYDSNHFLTSITRNGLTLKSYTYDAIGRTRTYTDSRGLTLTFDYNNLNDKVKITYPDGRYISRTYSADMPHLVAGQTDRSGLTTQYTFDNLGRPTQILNPEGGTTDYSYDKNGNPDQLTDPGNNVTTFSHNNDNKLTGKTYADGTAESYAYSGGRLSSHTNARGASAAYAYDGPDTIGQVLYLNDTTYTTSVMNQHDQYHRLTTSTDNAGTSSYTYDSNSRLTLLDGPLSNDNITFQYDASGRKTGYTLQGGQTATYTYDAFDRMTQLQGSAGTFTFSYNAANPILQRLTRPNGSYTDYQYDSMMRLTAVINRSSSGTVINKYEYTYNEQDLQSSETVTNGTPIDTFQNESVTYVYNGVNKLTASTGRTGYTHDLDGNMTNGYAVGGALFTAVYDAENRLTSMDFQGPDTCSFMGYTFPCEHSRDYTYSYYGRLAEINQQDGLTPSVTTRYVGYGVQPLQERDEHNAVLREYTWGPDFGKDIGRLLSVRQGGQDYYYLYDGKGNVTAIIDNAQAVVAAYAYDPFGRLMTKTGTLDQPFQFMTKLYDEKSGLCYGGQRYYSPDLGRWLSRKINGKYAPPVYGLNNE